MIGRGTEFISIYIPKGKNVIPYLKQEKSTAKNIKSDRIRHEVEKNLERCIQRLKNGDTGFALFSGNNSLYEVEGDYPWYYRCSKNFNTQMIDSFLNSQDVIVGIVTLDAKESGFGILKQNGHVELLKVITSGIPSKHSKGGQSSQRFKHLHEEAKHNFFKRVAEYTRYYFLDNGKVDRLIIHGESFTKREFIKSNLLEYRLQAKVELSDGCYAGEDGLYECSNMLRACKE